jgi:hypothetical protein
MLDTELTTEWQSCGGCGGRNAHHARACEFCARLLAGAAAAPPIQRHLPSSWLLSILLGLVLLGGLTLRLIDTLVVR